MPKFYGSAYLYTLMSRECRRINVPVEAYRPGDENADAEMVLGGAYDGLHLQIGHRSVTICAPTATPLEEGGGLWFIDLAEHKDLKSALDEGLRYAGRDEAPPSP